MYTLAVRRDFIARHYLIGGDWGDENLPNSHHFVLELRLSGETLDQHGYLCDIVDVEAHLEDVIGYYRDQMLNEKPEFEGLNPSIERFSRILAETLDARIIAPDAITLEVVLWETEDAWAAFKIQR
jgi:6-pyruvoyltetrahydropterin/6-carboxytetrahydropterin synthase